MTKGLPNDQTHRPGGKVRAIVAEWVNASPVYLNPRNEAHRGMEEADIILSALPPCSRVVLTKMEREKLVCCVRPGFSISVSNESHSANSLSSHIPMRLMSVLG
jgi:hypothetical protein